MGTPRPHIPGKMGTPSCDCAVQAFCDEWILTSRHNRGKAGLLTKLKYGLCMSVRGADAVLLK